MEGSREEGPAHQINWAFLQVCSRWCPFKKSESISKGHVFQNSLKFMGNLPLAHKKVKKAGIFNVTTPTICNSNTGVFCKCTIQRAQPHRAGAG